MSIGLDSDLPFTGSFSESIGQVGSWHGSRSRYRQRHSRTTLRGEDAGSENWPRIKGVSPMNPFTQALGPMPEGHMPEWVALYRDIPQNPELSMQETRTANLLVQRLRAMGFAVTSGVGGTDVAGILHNGDSPTDRASRPRRSAQVSDAGFRW